MPQKCKYLIVNANNAAWTQVDANIQGAVSAFMWTDNANQPNFVMNAVDATAAAAEFTAGRYFNLPNNGISAGVRYTIDPCKTWVRSSTANASGVYFHIEW